MEMGGASRKIYQGSVSISKFWVPPFWCVYYYIINRNCKSNGYFGALCPCGKKKIRSRSQSMHVGEKWSGNETTTSPAHRQHYKRSAANRAMILSAPWTHHYANAGNWSGYGDCAVLGLQCT